MRAIRLLSATSVVAAALLLAPRAQAAGQWYGRFDVSYNYLANHGWGSPNGSVNTVSKNGMGVDLAFGRDLGRVWAGGGIRGEFELTWKYNGVDHFNQQGTQLTGTSGHTRVVALMYNLINDFRPESTFDPYIGVGIGYADVHYSNYYGYNTATGKASSLDSLDSVLAYQVLAGFKFNVSRTVAVDLAYNWFVLSDPSLQEPRSAGFANTKSSYRTNSLTLGLDWTF